MLCRTGGKVHYMQREQNVQSIKYETGTNFWNYKWDSAFSYMLRIVSLFTLLHFNRSLPEEK